MITFGLSLFTFILGFSTGIIGCININKRKEKIQKQNENDLNNALNNLNDIPVLNLNDIHKNIYAAEHKYHNQYVQFKNLIVISIVHSVKYHTQIILTDSYGNYIRWIATPNDFNYSNFISDMLDLRIGDTISIIGKYIDNETIRYCKIYNDKVHIITPNKNLDI